MFSKKVKQCLIVLRAKNYKGDDYFIHLITVGGLIPGGRFPIYNFLSVFDVFGVANV